MHKYSENCQICKVLVANEPLDEFKAREKTWTDAVVKNFEQKEIQPGKKFVETKIEMPGYVITKIKVDELTLEFHVTYDEKFGGKPSVRIQISSPNKKGTWETKVTGKNTSPEGILQKIKEVWDGKYKKK